MTSTATEPASHALAVVGRLVDARVSHLQRRFLAERRDPAAVAALARLRRGVGKRPGEVTDILEFTFGDELSTWDGGDPTFAERAAHVAITYYALHQQSQGQPMHRRNRGLGTALRMLAPSDIPDPLARRFRILGTADSFAEVTHHLRGAIQLLRAGGVALDYGLLADQLYRWQFPHGPERVRLRWGREFYRTVKRDSAIDSAAPSS